MLAAHRRLNDAILAGLADGLTPVCVGRDEWTSEDPEARQIAAQACQWCHVRATCSTTAQDAQERFGVWGGVER